MKFEGTSGLWELIVSRKPDGNIYTDDDLDQYTALMFLTNSIRRNNDPDEKRSKSSKGWKWNNVLKGVWERGKERYGTGLKETIVIPSDPNALVERLDLLMASKAAGNTGVRNELVSICDELLRQNEIDKNQYKGIMLKIKC